MSSSLPVDVRAQSVLRRISGTSTGELHGAIPDAELMDEVANVIRDLLTVVRTGADHGRIVCISGKKKEKRTGKKPKDDK